MNNPDEHDNKVGKFFESIIKIFRNSTKNVPIKFILVNHIVPTLPYFLNAIREIGEIAIIIPKGSAKNSTIIETTFKNENVFKYEDLDDETKSQFSIEGVFDTRKYLKKNWKNVIDKYVGNEANFMIIDIGGYFAYSLMDIIAQYGARFYGVVEDTENGHQKYEKEIGNYLDNHSREPINRIPIMSVARSELKKTEDYNVGKSIVQAADTILRETAHTIIERFKCITVIGFGKIGRSIAEHLRQKNVRRVVIYEKDNIKLFEAVSLGFEIKNKSDALTQSDMIFGATGNQSIDDIDFTHLKNNVFIASCTSREDEFGLKLIKILEKSKKLVQTHCDKITKYKYNDNVINMLHRGGAVNFLYDAVNGPFIFSVQAALIVSALKLKSMINNGDFNQTISSSPNGQKHILELDSEAMQVIARLWLYHFENYSDKMKECVSEKVK